jgi:hypothetical protein
VTQLINNSAEIWDKIKTIGGLDLNFYDTDLEVEIINNLGLSNDKKLDYWLGKQNISIEDFLAAFFVAAQPFSLMMSDLLKMFEQEGIKHTNENLNIEFNFDSKLPNFDFDLTSFKIWLSNWKELEQTYVFNVWNHNTIWMLNSIFRDLSVKISDPSILKWERIYETQLRWPDLIPDLPKTNNNELNLLLEKAYNVFKQVHTYSSRFDSSREKLWKVGRAKIEQTENDSIVEIWPLHLLARIDHDKWSSSFIKGLYSIVDQINKSNPDLSSALSSEIFSKLTELYSSLETKSIIKKDLVEEIKEFLDLPIWKKRYELYSVWISTQIRLALDKHSVRIHQINQRIIFSFSGTHFATVDSLTPRLHIWSELRAPLYNPIGKSRKKAIQPDYSLVQDPISDSSSSIIEIECKQYKTASKTNFLHAVIDYAKGKPNAHIILVNYGIIGHKITESIPENIKERVTMIGNMKPGSTTSINAFNNLIIRIIDKNYYSQNSEGGFSKLTLSTDDKIILSWESEPEDLDIYLGFEHSGQQYQINYKTKGGTDVLPFAFLDNDMISGNGKEVITIKKWIGEKYTFSIHNYSNDTDLNKSKAKVTFKTSNKEFEFNCPDEGRGRWWHVFTVFPNENKLEVINKLTDSEKKIMRNNKK